MNIKKVNLLKIFLLKLLEVECSSDDIRHQLQREGIENISYGLINKTLISMVNEELLYLNGESYVRSPKGEFNFNMMKNNLKEFVEKLFQENLDISTEVDLTEAESFVDTLIAFKTVPVDLSNIGYGTLGDFFEYKIEFNQPYYFQNRKMGLSKYYQSYTYDNYGILFVNQSLVECIGLVDKYSNQGNGELYLKKVIQLDVPITIMDIRKHVRENFNQSQQKQEFFLEGEVNKMKNLILKKAGEGYRIIEK